MATTIEGLWISDENGRPRLEFHADGTVAGTDGCNGIHTTFTLDGATATLAPALSTLKACTGVDTWLRAVHTVSLEGDELAVYDRAGAKIGRLVREDS